MDRKQKLLDRENYLLNEIQYYEKRIELALNKEAPISTNCNDNDSSDLEYEIKVNNEPSLLNLKLEKKKLQTCLLATIELADVTVVQSEINIIPDDPVFDREPRISERGVWKEIIAECRIGMIPFTINFFTHQAYRLFAPILFRNLNVLPIKKPQEVELSRSVLSRVTEPSHAIQVLRSYESAYRSRRTTLAKLSDKYVDLSMECKDDGGYVIKCDKILNITWFLQNKYSYLSRFQHKMSFDLEFIDESYVKIIRKANKRLENQSIETEERTQLLSAIIDACLKAKGMLESHSESDNERAQLPSETKEQNMAPPKTLPKKTKKNKENSPKENLVEINPKKAKTDQVLKANNGNKDAPQKKKDTDKIIEAQAKDKDSNLIDNTTNGSVKRMNDNVHKIKNIKKDVTQQKTKNGNVVSDNKGTNKEKPEKKITVNVVKDSNVASGNKVETGNTNKVLNKKNQGNGMENVLKDGNVASKNIQIIENKIIKTGGSNDNNNGNTQNNKRKVEVTEKLPAKKVKTSTNVATANIVESKKQSANINNGIQKSNSNKDRVAISKNVKNTVNNTNFTEKTKIPTSTVVNKNNENSKPKQNAKENTKKTTLDDKIVTNNKAQIINKPATDNVASKVQKLQPNSANMVTKPNVTTQKTGNKKVETNGNTQKENPPNNVIMCKSKIPQKRQYSHKNPLEIRVKTQMKQPSKLAVKSSKPTNIPIAKRP